MFAVRAPHAFDGERFLPGGATVLVEGDHIVGIEPFGFSPPDGVDVTSYDGTLLPGLIDAHVHLVSDASLGSLERSGALDDHALDAMIGASLTQQAAGGVTTVRDLGDRSYRTLVARDRAEAGVPRVVAAGPPLTTPGGHCHFLGGVVDGTDAIRAAVTERADRGVDVVKVMASGGLLTLGTDVMGVQFTAEELRAVVEAAHRRDLPVYAHAHSLAGAWHALSAGVDGIEHFTCLTPTGTETPDDVLAAIAATGTVVSPTMGLDPARLPPPELMPPALHDLVERMGLSLERLRAFRGEQMRRAREHGVTVISGLDAGAGPAKPHGSVWISVDWLLDGGYPVAEALATATSGAADACGVGDVTGRLRASYAADLLVVDGDLERDPSALGRPAAVWVRGVTP